MNHRSVVLAVVTWMTIATASAFASDAHGMPGERSERAAVEPQLAVVCTGWHALCTGSVDCQTTGGGMADCACWRVNETHIVVTSEIQDPTVKRLTQTRCTSKNACGIDEAPVCSAIRDGQYKVDEVKHDWVSTYSYRGWCGLYRPKACDTTEPDYDGDMQWAICDAAPCTEIANPADPDRPLSCQCRVMEGPFVGGVDSCTGEDGGIISAMALEYWDFETNDYTVPIPGYDYVRGACASLHSDPWPPPQP